MRPEKVNMRTPVKVNQKNPNMCDKTFGKLDNINAIKAYTSNKEGDISHFDISKLVDDCFGEEENSDEMELILSHLNPESCSLSTMMISPKFDLTFEEDFRIHELMVRKENLFDGFYRIFLEFPNFVCLWERFLLQIKSSCPVIQSAVPADSYDCKMKNMVRKNFVEGLKFLLLIFVY